MGTVTERRSCKGTKKAGGPCTANPVTGYDYCMGHLDPATKEALGFGGKQPNSGRPRKIREVDEIRERIEQQPGKIFDVLWEALEATTHVWNGPENDATEVPDHKTRIMAARELLDRAYGRPKQTAEVTLIEESQLDTAIRRMEEQLAADDSVGSGDTAGEDRAVQGASG